MENSSPNKKKLDSTAEGPIVPFLVPSTSSILQEEPMETLNKMLDGKEPSQPQRDRITKHDLITTLVEHRTGILDSITQILSPLKEQLSTMHKDLQKITQTADAALEAPISSNENIRNLQTHECWAHEEIIT